MSKRLAKPIIIDMLTYVERIQDYTVQMSFDDFLSDTKTQDAVIRNILVLGEAARIPDDLKDRYPEIEWSKIVRSRHIVTHEYDDVDLSIIWRIVSIYSVSLKHSLETRLSEL